MACSGGSRPTGSIGLGLNILKMYPLPNNQSTTIGTNHQFIRPTFDTLLYQPAIKLDYQITQGLRVSVKYQGNNMSKRDTLVSLPGWNDAIVPIPRKGTEAVTVNYSINATTFLEGTYGRAGNQLAGCGGIPVNDVSDSRTTGLANLPLIFPNANNINPDYYAFEILQFQKPPYWDGTQIYKVPSFQWGNRIVSGTRQPVRRHPTSSIPGFLNINTTQDVAINLTKVMGSHTFKTGFYNNHSLKRENNVLGGTNFGTINFQHDTVGVNPFDTALRVRERRHRELQLLRPGVRVRRGHIQLRQPRSLRAGQLEGEAQAGRSTTASASCMPSRSTTRSCRAAISCRTSGCSPQSPALYVPGCVGNTATCTGSNRSAKNPLTGELLGPNTRAGHRHARAELRRGEERPVPVWEGNRGHDLFVPEVERRPALRYGLRSVGRPARRPARFARPLLRSAARW